MALVYFDSSAFVKLLVNENGTDLAVELWDSCDAAVASVLAYPEVRAALAAAKRTARLTDRQLRGVEREWERYWATTRTMGLNDALARAAGDLCRAHALRGADGVHLASALALANDGIDDLIVAVWDERLKTGSLATGLRVAPA